jgi:iron(III) transport system permease protein
MRPGALVLPGKFALRDHLMALTLSLVVLFWGVLVLYPLLWLVLGALGLPRDLSLVYIARVFTDPANVGPLKNTLVLALGSALGSVVLGAPLAWATARTDMPLRQVVHALVALGYIIPPYLSAVAYIILLGPNAGHLNRLLAALTGVPGAVNIFSAGGVIFVVTLHVFAFTYFLTYAALQSIDTSLEDAAQALGASRWEVFRRVTLPLVAPAVTGGALLAAVESMALFGPQAILGLPAQVVYLATRIYGAVGSYPPRYADASALSLLLVLLTLTGLFLQRRYLEQRAFVTIGGRGPQWRTVTLGLWRWPLLIFCGSVVLCSAVAPLAVLLGAAFSRDWTQPLSPANITLHNFRVALVDNQIAVRGILNSFRLAAAAATVATILGVFLAYIDLRTGFRGRRLLDYISTLPLGLPGTVLAVAVLQAFIRPPVLLYGTIWIVLVAYCVRYLPQAVRSANAALRQIDPSLEESARITGASWLRAVRLVLVPLIRPGLLVAWLLVFIPSLNELSATILLYSSGTETISVAIFRLNDLGQLEVVAALAVFTIGVILLASLALQYLARYGSPARTAEIRTA